MRIDAHQHFWVYNPAEYGWIDESMSALRRNFLPDDLCPELRNADFQGSIVVQARQTLEETRWLLELADISPSLLGVVGWVDLCSSECRSQLETFSKSPKLVGIRHIVQSEPDDRFLMRPDFLEGVAFLEQFGLAYDILMADGLPWFPPPYSRVRSWLDRRVRTQSAWAWASNRCSRA